MLCVPQVGTPIERAGHLQVSMALLGNAFELPSARAAPTRARSRPGFAAPSAAVLIAPRALDTGHRGRRGRRRNLPRLIRHWRTLSHTVDQQATARLCPRRCRPQQSPSASLRALHNHSRHRSTRRSRRNIATCRTSSGSRTVLPSSAAANRHALRFCTYVHMTFDIG